MALQPIARVEPGIPKMDASSAVFPTVRVVEEALIVAFHVPGCCDSAAVRFEGVTQWAYGAPNDEGLASHPLWGHGLTFYEFHRTSNHQDERDCWIATFHDGTLTVHAKSITVLAENVPGAPSDAIDSLLGPGMNRVLDEER